MAMWYLEKLVEKWFKWFQRCRYGIRV
jgi:hypothetical protein